MIKRLAFFTLISGCTLLSSCFLLGLHVNVHNPSRPGKYPRFSQADILLGDQNSKFRKCYDVNYYGISLKIDPDKKLLTGAVVIQATALEDFDTLQVDLKPNFKINRIYTHSGGSHLSNQPNFIRKEGAVFVAMPQRIHQGDVVLLQIFYEGIPKTAAKPPWKEGFTWKKDKDKNPWIGVSCESDGASIWWPCKDVTNDEPDSVFMSISVPKGLTAVCNGQRLPNAEGRLYRDVWDGNNESRKNYDTHHWLVTYPINPYNVTVYVGQFSHLQDSMVSSVTGRTLKMDYYVLPSNIEKAKTHFQQAKAQLQFFEVKFGEYPWYRDGYKLIEAPYSGMEHQSAIAYGSGYKNTGDGFDYIILHESAHEWWGNAITASDLSDVWLQEGFATYSEALYVEKTQGKNAYLSYLHFYRLFIRNKWPVTGPQNRRYFYFRNSDCYQKGAWILHTLRNTIQNDSLFFGILKDYYAKYRYTTCTSQDFIRMVNEKTGKDYSNFFQQYLYNRMAPILEFVWYGDYLYYRWTDANPDFRMEVQFTLDGQEIVRLSPTLHLQRIKMPPGTWQSGTFNNLELFYGIKKEKRLLKKFDFTRNP